MKVQRGKTQLTGRHRIVIRFEILIEQHHDEIYRYLWRLLAGVGGAGETLEAQDLAQEVFMRAYRAFDRLSPGSNYRAWLYRIATNCALTALKNGHRWARRTTPLPDEDMSRALVDAAPSPQQQIDHAEVVGAVRDAIVNLPDKQRSALVMRYLQEMDYADIAQALGCSVESARANVSQAIRRLRSEFGENVRRVMGVQDGRAD